MFEPIRLDIGIAAAKTTAETCMMKIGASRPLIVQQLDQKMCFHRRFSVAISVREFPHVARTASQAKHFRAEGLKTLVQRYETLQLCGKLK